MNMLRHVFWLSSDNLIEQILVGMVLRFKYVSTPCHFRQDTFEERRRRAKRLCANHAIPESLELFPPRRIEEVLGLVLDGSMSQRGPGDRRPTIELPVR